MVDGNDRVEARVRAAFGAEELRPESDLLPDPLRPHARSRRRRALIGLATVALVAAVAVATAGLIHVSRLGAGPAASPTSDRYSDGIPRQWQGQPVLRWGDAMARRTTASDDTPFLVAAWVEMLDGWNCPAQGTDPWDPTECGFKSISADAGGPGNEPDTVSFHFFQGTLVSGPAILRVHLHDPRSNLCLGQEAICDSEIVVEKALWTGDSFTAPRPFSVADVIAAASAVDPGRPLAVTSKPYMDTGFAGAAKLSQGKTAYLEDYGQIMTAFVAPSAAAVARRLPDEKPSVSGALATSALDSWGSASGPGFSHVYDYRWFVVENVAFMVQTARPPSDSDVAWLHRLEAALRATHS
jgi:hypothetical protein